MFLALCRPLNLVLGGDRRARNGKAEVTKDDVDLVMATLGIDGWSGNCDERCLLEGVGVLLEEKTASCEELEEAFGVFDGDGDGFIGHVELHDVMGRLGLMEDTKGEDCERMIKVFDQDGDGRISFDEFKAMMQGAV